MQAVRSATGMVLGKSRPNQPTARLSRQLDGVRVGGTASCLVAAADPLWQFGYHAKGKLVPLLLPPVIRGGRHFFDNSTLKEENKETIIPANNTYLEELPTYRLKSRPKFRT